MVEAAYMLGLVQQNLRPPRLSGLAAIPRWAVIKIGLSSAAAWSGGPERKEVTHEHHPCGGESDPRADAPLLGLTGRSLGGIHKEIGTLFQQLGPYASALVVAIAPLWL